MPQPEMILAPSRASAAIMCRQQAPDAFGADSTRVTEMAIERAELALAGRDYAHVLQDLVPLIARFRREFGDERVSPVEMAQAYLAAAKSRWITSARLRKRDRRTTLYFGRRGEKPCYGYLARPFFMLS